LHKILTQRENRYLARQLCWTMRIAGLDTYILVPGYSDDLELLIESLRPTPDPGDIDVVIGQQVSIAPPTLCNGLVVPIVVFDQIYSFKVDSLIDSIPRPQNVEAERFRATAVELFRRVIDIADNAGATDEHRALNYCLVRYPAVYSAVADAHAKNAF